MNEPITASDEAPEEASWLHRPATVGTSALFVSVGLLMAGTGLQQILLGVRGTALGFRNLETGAVLSAYYLGYLLGSIQVPHLIGRVGHIRVFAALASAASAAVLLHAVFLFPVPWGVIRFFHGACMAGLFVVAESWLNEAATNETRGHLLSSYMVVVLGAMGAGQLLLNVADVEGAELFILSSILVSAAVVPVSLTRHGAPILTEPESITTRALFPRAPLGVAGAVASGCVFGALLGFGAVYARLVGLTVAQTSLLVASAIFVGAATQWPIGRLSDLTDRRRVIALVALAGAATAGVAAVTGAGRVGLLVVLVGVLGGGALPLYPLCLAQVNDALEPRELLAASSRLMVLNALGAAAGPLAAAVAVELVGPAGFFWLPAAVLGLLGTYGLVQIGLRPRETEPVPYAPVPPTATLIATSGLNPVIADPGPVTTGTLEHDDVVLAWREQGQGPLVVLVHGVGQSQEVWRNQLPDLAAHDHRTVVYDLRGHGASTSGPRYRLEDHFADLVALLDHLGVTRAHLVGLDGGATIAAAVAAQHSDRVATLTVTGGVRPLDPDARRSPPRAGLASGSRWVGQALSRGHAGAQIRARTAYEPDEEPDRFALLVRDWRRANPRALRESSSALELPARPPVLPDGLPVCCIVGDQDSQARLKTADRVAAAYGASFHRIEGSKRLPPLDRPVHFDAVVIEFLVEHNDLLTTPPTSGDT